MLSSLIATMVLAPSFGANTLNTRPIHDPSPPAPPDQLWSIDQGSGRIRATVAWQDEGLSDEHYLYCTKSCRGKIHLLHSQCDDSCDRACDEIHKFDEPPQLRVLEQSIAGWNTLTKDFQKFGTGNYSGAAIEYTLRKSIQESLDKNADKLTAKIDWRHWFDGSCGAQVRVLKAHLYLGVVSYQLFREVEGPDGKIIKTSGPTGTVRAFRLVIFTDAYETQKAYTNCRCSIVSEEKEHGYIPPPADTQTGVCLVTPQGNVQATDKLLEQCSFEASCQNMNVCTFTAENPTDQPMTLCVNPGTILECQDDRHQNMVCVSTVKMTLPPKTVFASIIPELAGGKVTARGEVACINMRKKEPTADVKFKPGLPTNSGYQRIAAFQAKQRIQGPWDQARIWIYTDQATYGDIQELMLPAPNKGSYARALYQLAHDCQIDLSDPKYDKCFDPALLGGTTLYPEMTSWLVNQLAQRDAGKLAKWVQGSATDFADAFSKPDKLTYEHWAALAKALATCSNEVVQNAAADLLLKVIPAELRAKTGEAGACNGVLLWLSQKNPERAKLALDIYEAYKPQGAAMFLLTPHPELPADIKSRAANLAKG